MSSDLWLLNKDLCRCCHAEGSFSNLAQPSEDSQDVYSDLLKDCFNIEMCPVPGQLCSITYKICKACILRLDDACKFKKQVQLCETKFLDMHRRDVIKVLDGSFHSVVKEEASDDSIDFSLLDNDNMDDEDYDMKEEQDETDIPIAELKKIKTKRKSVQKAKPKKTSAKRGKIKEEAEGEETIEAEVSESTKSGVREEQNYTMTRDEDGTECYTCKLCQRVYRRRDCMTQHYKHVHLKLRPKLRGCYLCQEKVPGHVRAFHLEKVHGIPAPTCNACGKKFAYPFQVLRHQQTEHMGEKKFICDTCGMAFSFRKNLAQHVWKHSTIRNFSCQYCEQSFKWKKHLTQHLKVHMKKQNC